MKAVLCLYDGLEVRRTPEISVDNALAGVNCLKAQENKPLAPRGHQHD